MNATPAGLRETAFVLSRNSYTPVGYWMGLPLRELAGWLATNNDVVGRMNEERRASRKS